MDEELRKLCEEVHAKTGWIIVRNGGVGYDYTSDYLLEKLPKELHKDEKIHYLSLSAKYGDEFKANYISPTGYLYLFLEPESYTPLKALLKLTITLIDAGELSNGKD